MAPLVVLICLFLIIIHDHLLTWMFSWKHTHMHKYTHAHVPKHLHKHTLMVFFFFFSWKSSSSFKSPSLEFVFSIFLVVCVLVTQLCLILCDSMDYIAHQAPLSMEFSRQEYCCGLPFPSPGDLLNSGIKPGSPAEQADSLPTEPPGKPINGTIYKSLPQSFWNCLVFCCYCSVGFTLNYGVLLF